MLHIFYYIVTCIPACRQCNQTEHVSKSPRVDGDTAAAGLTAKSESGTHGADHVTCACSHSEYTERNDTVFIVSILYTV